MPYQVSWNEKDKLIHVSFGERAAGHDIIGALMKISDGERDHRRYHQLWDFTSADALHLLSRDMKIIRRLLVEKCPGYASNGVRLAVVAPAAEVFFRVQAVLSLANHLTILKKVFRNREEALLWLGAFTSH